MITDHRAVPGPLYWDFRCLRCDAAVAEHSWWGWLWRRAGSTFNHDGECGYADNSAF